MRYDVGRKIRKQKDGNADGEDYLEYMFLEYLGGEYNEGSRRVAHGHWVNIVYKDTKP